MGRGGENASQPQLGAARGEEGENATTAAIATASVTNSEPRGIIVGLDIVIRALRWERRRNTMDD
jgi:hypothetical protein